jgi:hypothetical protein
VHDIKADCFGRKTAEIMPSSIREVDLKEALRDYHRRQCCDGNNSSSNNDDAMDTGSIRSSAPSASEPVFGWDETVADDECSSSSDAADVTNTFQQRLHIKSGGSLTPHAMAHRSWIYGIVEAEAYGSNHKTDHDTSSLQDYPWRSHNQQHGSQSEPERKIRWKTSLAPHRIQQIASNTSGTVIAATTDNGTVSIIRGRDGRVLATRRVAEAKTDKDYTGDTPSSSVSFVTTKVAGQSMINNPRDALLVQTPDQPALLVSNIQGDRLNDDNDIVVTQATKSMNLQVVQIPSIESSDVQCMCGYFYSSNKNDDDDENKEESKDYYEQIRLVLIHHDLSGEARLALAGYDLGSQLCHLLQKNISVTKGSELEIDTLVGLRLTSILDRFIIALVVHPTIRQTIKHQKALQHQQSTCSKILWLDPDYDLGSNQEEIPSKYLHDNDIVIIRGEYPLVTSLKEDGITEEHYKRYQRSRIQALEFVNSFDSQEAMAMVVAMGETGGETSSEMQIMQAQVKNDGNGRMLQLGRAHTLYQIHMPSTVARARSISFCPLDLKIYGPYSFCSKSSLGWNHHGQIHTFQTRALGDKLNDCYAIGAIRLLITKNEFDQARALVHEIGMEVLLGDESAHFHPAEIVLQSLRQSLSQSLESNNTVSSFNIPCLDDHWNESLIGLGRGAGNSKGQLVFLEAADYVLNWPPKTDISNLNYELVVERLGSFLKTMRNVSDDFLDQDVPSWITATYNNRIHALEEKLTAMAYMHSLLNSKSEIEISPQYSSVGSIDDLFFCFVQNDNFTAAEKIWGSTMRSKLTASVLVSSILQIPSMVHPRKYTNLLEYIVLPSLSINHELLSSILSWSCGLADDFDTTNEHGLERSIFLLETIVRATKRLRLKVHSSFAYYSPFVHQKTDGNSKGRLLSTKERNGIDVSTTGILSLDSSFGLVSHPSDDSISLGGRRKKKPRISSDDNQPNPTVLELGRMKRGATRLGQVQSLSVDTIDENEEIVDTKLQTARWLKLARSLGLSRELLYLHNFVDQGGVRYASKELIRLYSSSANSHEERYDALTKKVKNFCSVSHAGYDEALIEYSKELCRGRNTNSRYIEEVASIARCCLCPTSKCQITKIALQAALFCRFSPIWLTNLSKDAIEWSAGDSSLRSELEESSRLLLIDGIVGRYCGNGAKELFHIDNPLHATRLLDFVSKHLNHSTVLSDILDLCEAFHHLSVEDGCGRLMQNAILRGHQEMAINILESLYDRNSTSAHNVFSRVVCFCIDLIEDNSSHPGAFPGIDSEIESSMRLKESKIISNCAYELTKIALVHSRMIIRGRFGSGFTTWQYDEGRLQILLLDLERLIALQQDHSIFVSLSDLNDPKAMVGIASKLLDNLANMYLNGEINAASMIVTQTKKACSLLSRAPQLTESDLLFTAAAPIACRLALRTNGFEAFDFLTDLRILEASQCNLAARCCIAVSLSYCRKFSKSNSCLSDTMEGLVMASSLLQDYILSHCPPEMLGVAIDFSQLCDIVSQVLARADEGFGEKLAKFRKTLLERAAEKRWSFALSNSISRNNLGESVRISQPMLHPSWYVGDGLLLPPEEAVRKSIDYCKQTMGLKTMDDISMGIHAFVANQGAHALALRILSHSTTVQICLHRNENGFDELEGFNQRISIALVERYLGGTGNGITSGVVDSQLAASFLLSLPLKLAFKIYRSSLPTAINTRDFRRVVTLATIGKVCGSKDSIMSPTGARLGNWTRQNKFVSQCDHLATRANWWSVLEEYNVNFNPHSFDDEKPVDRLEDSYIASIIPALISNMMSRKDGQIDCTLVLAIKFANAFSIPTDLPACRFIQYLLSPTKSDGGQHVREKVSCLNDTVRNLLRSLSSSSKRVNILRRCLIQFESHGNCVDYERLSIIYALYQTELSLILSKDLTKENDSIDNMYMEMEAIDRRRDALAILSSYFQGDKKDERPSFSKFFAPLNESIDDNSNISIKSTRFSSKVLGWEAAPEAGTFDPLDPLENILRSSCSSAVSSALSPICIPLCVPRGYIKVRSMITRFQKSRDEGASLPTFEDDVVPVLNQLRAPSDVAELAEWCSKQYELNTPDKLNCLDHALDYAIKASTEAESGADQRKEGFDTQRGGNESATLARVKRITVAKDLLEDRLEITKILQPQNTKRKNQGSVSNILEKLLEKLEAEVWCKSNTFVPERFVDALFIEASLLVAEATLCASHSLSVGQFRQLSHLVHRVCNSIAHKYSHVQSGYLARRLTKRWLLYGDEQSSETEGEKDNNMIQVMSQSDKLFPDIEEEDTMNFQMDLSILKEDPSNFSMAAFSSMNEKKRLTSEEEPSSLEATSRREMSELASHRSALRIAFVMAFADGYHRSLTEDPYEENDENSRKDVNCKSSKTPRRGLLSKTKTKVKHQVNQHSSVLQHARDLIRIVFAKSTSADRVMMGINSSFDSVSVAGIDRNNPATITFAMRHRCLRVASILVPQEALEEVLNEDELNPNLSLKACSFGSFCAKELEEMGLPIPHSDLLQLSQMHFPSYARALWRHHRDIKGAKGRLLLLILELYLKETISDNGFFLSIMKEIEALNLPRTLLLGFECIIRYMDKIGPENVLPFLEANNTEISRITGKLLQLVYADLKRNIETFKPDEIGNDGFKDRRCTMNTLSRLSSVVGAFSDTSEGQRLLLEFCQELLKSFPVLANTGNERQCLRIALEYAIFRIETENIQVDLFERLSKFIGSSTLGGRMENEHGDTLPSPSPLCIS